MIHRISTAGLHQQGLVGLLKRQADVAETQRQMVTGTRIERAGQDPVGFATGQRLDHALATLEQYERNASLVGHRLQLQEHALGDVGDALTRARELAVQGNNATLSQSDRASLAQEILALRRDLISIGNRDDGNGRTLFAGTRHAVVPFTDTAGSVGYAGDDTRNAVDVAPGQSVEDADTGSAVFLRVRTGDGVVRGAPAAANTGTGVLVTSSVIDYGNWPNAPLTVAFTAPDAYEVRDGTGAVLATGAYTQGQAIRAGGVQVELTGAPAAGDAFTVAPAPTRDIFATLQQLADALTAPVGTQAERARRDNAVNASIGDLASAQDHILALRGAGGSRLQSLAIAADANGAGGLSLKESLSSLRDVDYAEATTRLSLQLTAIDAAQRTMLRIQGMSLFDRM